MKLITPPLIIDVNNSFSNDLFNRKSFGDKLVNLITRSSDSSLVISLDGKWGEGKTTFIKMWQGLLQESKVSSIYIDAFQSDHIDDAFIVIAGAINSFIDINIQDINKKVNFKEKAKKVGVSLLSLGAKIGIKAATLGTVNDSHIHSLTEIGKDIAKDTSDFFEKIVFEQLNNYKQEIELIESFKNSLSEIPIKLKNNDSKKLVIIIDELDRCRPSFAVEVLEKIKHLFSVKNVIFLLVINKEQLHEAIKCIYGNNIDAHTYLQKFISIETSLPKNIADKHNNDSLIYIKKLIDLHEIDTHGKHSSIIDCFNYFSRLFNLSLRQLEKTFTNLVIIFNISNKNNLNLIIIITFIAVIKVVNSKIFNKIMFEDISYADLKNEILEYSKVPSIRNDRILKSLFDWLQYLMLSDAEIHNLLTSNPDKIYHKVLIEWNIHLERMKIIPYFCQELNMFSVNVN